MSFCCRKWPNCDGCPRLPVVPDKEGDSGQDQKKEPERISVPTINLGFGE